MIALPASSSQVAEILSHSLASVFANLCTQRYGGPLSFRRLAAPAEAPSTAHFVLERSGTALVEATFTIRHIGGNMYDLVGMVDGGPTQSFSYCLPDSALHGPPQQAPHLAQAVTLFLLDALERRLGSDLLRQSLLPLQPKTGARPASSPAHAPSVV